MKPRGWGGAASPALTPAPPQLMANPAVTAAPPRGRAGPRAAGMLRWEPRGCSAPGRYRGGAGGGSWDIPVRIPRTSRAHPAPTPFTILTYILVISVPAPLRAAQPSRRGDALAPAGTPSPARCGRCSGTKRYCRRSAPYSTVTSMRWIVMFWLLFFFPSLRIYDVVSGLIARWLR